MRNPNRASTAASHSWMNRSVRVLNATYEYLGEVSADRAVVLIATGSAQSTEDVIPIFPVRSKHIEIPLPRTILLAEYVYVAHRVTVTDSSRATFAGVFDRDGRQCAYCAARATTIDHVQPRSRNGPNTWGNLVACCSSCNQRKADRTPAEAGMRLLWEPKAPRRIEKAQQKIWRELSRT